MKSRDLRRLSGAKLSEEVLTNNTSATSGIPDMAAKLAGLGAKILIVESNLILAGDPSSGVTINVKAIRETMILSVYRCAKAIVNFASDAPVKDILRSQAKVTLTQLRGISKEACGLKCEAIMALAVANAAGILPKGITATDITDAQNLVTLFNADKLSPEEKIQLKKAKNKIAIDTLDDIMLDYLPNSVDTLVDTLIISDKDFYDLYYQSRRIIHVGQGTTRITYTLMQGANPVNAATGAIENKMVLKKPRTKPYPVQISSPEGFIVHDKLGTGLFDITIEKEGYVTKVIRDKRVKLGANLPLGDIQLAFAEIIIPFGPGETLVVFFPDSPQWAIGNTINVKNITTGDAISLPNTYNADNENSPYSGTGDTQLANGQEFTALITAGGFKPYMKLFNNSANPGVIRIRIS